MFNKRKIPPGVEVYEITEPFSFGALHRYWTTLCMIGNVPKAIIVVLTKVYFLDESDLYLFQSFCEVCYRKKTKLILIGVQPQPLSLIRKDGLYDLVGPQNIVDTIPRALRRLADTIKKFE